MRRVTVHLAAPLRPLVKGKPRVRVQVEGDALGDLLAALTRDHPELSAALVNAGGELRPQVTIYVDEEDARDIGRWSATLGTDVHIIVPATV